MAELVKGLFGGAKSAVSSVASDVDDFADFATAASPLPPSHAASSAFSATPTPKAAGLGGGLANLIGTPISTANRPYTKWYRIWERVTLADFYQELVLIPFLLVIILVNLVGSRLNKSRAKRWAAAHLPIIESEFASVGFGGGKGGTKVGDVQSQGLAKAMAGSQDVPEELLKQKAKNEYILYATGRQNVAYLHTLLTLHKRYNPFVWFGEAALSFLMDSVAAPVERVEATLYPFDGKEKTLIQNVEGGVKDSSYDNFVWAIVHKDKMKQLRDDRYDLSLTVTRDNAKLPDFCTVMTESAEISDALLTPELIKAVTAAGEDLEALIISDQPIDAPKKLNDTLPTKRLSLSLRLNPNGSTSLFAYFLRLPDILVQTAHFRSEALRKIKQTREEEQRKIKKVDEEEKAEERKTQSDRLKKEERERKLKGMSAEEQRKFLEREADAERKKGMKRRTQRA